jgi:Helicase associated domain
MRFLLAMVALWTSTSHTSGLIVAFRTTTRSLGKSYFVRLLHVAVPGSGCIISDNNVKTIKIDDVVVDTSAFGKAKETTTGSNKCASSILGGTDDGGAWMNRYNELVEFHTTYGHAIVPKRYKDNPTLGNWVNKQRQHYRNYMQLERPCSLTKKRIDLLNQLQFCWDASICSKLNNKCLVSSANNDVWWKQYNMLKSIIHSPSSVSENNHDDNIFHGPINYVHRYNSILGNWIDKQRELYSNNQTVFSCEKVEALQQLDHYWYMTPRDYLWEKRFLQLQEYKSNNGDCCVPIGYVHNKQLGQWVSNQRKKYKCIPALISENRIERLNSIGFVWNRWEYEFNKKQVQFQ